MKRDEFRIPEVELLGNIGKAVSPYSSVLSAELVPEGDSTILLINCVVSPDAFEAVVAAASLAVQGSESDDFVLRIEPRHPHDVPQSNISYTGSSRR